jgi:putative peptide zinc metalloprotease protein
MRRRLRHLGIAIVASLTFAAAIGTGAHPVAAAPGDGSGSDNTAIAVNTKDGSALFRFAFGITKATGEVVDAGNAAVSYASCTACQTVSIAIQFVIVEGSPDVFAPENVAVAVNDSCTLCDTMATAYQFVIQTTGPVKLTKDGRRRMHDLVKQIRDLEDAGLTGPEIAARVDVIAHEMYDVMRTSLVPVDEGDNNDDNDHGGDATVAPTTSTTVAHDTATTTSTTEVVRSSTTTTTRPASSTSSSTTTTTTPSTTTTTTAP